MSTTPTSAGATRHVGDRSNLPGLPEGLFVAERPPRGGWGTGAGPVVVFVHGSLDRGASFARAASRLDDLGVVTYDRRGYQRSRGVPVSDDLAVHVHDLVRIATSYAEHRAAGSGVIVLGHSVGATIALGAAVEEPAGIGAIGGYEPSMPWLGLHRRGSPGSRADRDGSADPGLEAERFFRRMVGDAAWERLSQERREELRADGPALLADVRAIRRDTPFDVTALAVPAIVGSGGASSLAHHLDTADWLATHVPAVRRSTIGGAGHGAHLSHPDAFAALVREVAALGRRAEDPR